MTGRACLARLAVGFAYLACLAVRFACLAVGFACLAVTACADPVHDDAVRALGGEVAGVPVGPHHRPGQPCLVCHGGEGPGDAEFSIAGTVYQAEDTKVVLQNALVRLVDATGRKHEVATNCAGNFFVTSRDYEPAYPVWVKLVFGHQGQTPIERAMGSPVYREGSCAACHRDSPGTESVGRVSFLPAGRPPLPPPRCPP